MELSDGSGRLSLPGMPTEVLSIIIDLAGPATLPVLRLTNKRICAVSNEPFAIKHFSERRHVQSAYSMDALIEITAHPFFGKYVKRVIISGSRPKIRRKPSLKGVARSCVQCPSPNPLCKNPAPHHLALDYLRLPNKLKETFFNIRRHSSSVIIGVCDSAFRCYGSRYYHADCNMLFNQSLRSETYISRRDDCNLFVLTFEDILEAAQKSGCKIVDIKLDTFSAYMPCSDTTPQESEVQRMLRQVLHRLSEHLSFELNLEMDSTFKPRHYLEYGRNTGELDLVGFIFESPPGRFDPTPHVEMLLSWLSNRSLAQINLRDCLFEKSNLSWLYHSQTLRQLTLHNVTLYTGHFEINLWSTILDRLARAPHLRYLEILQCRYSFAEVFNDDTDHHHKPLFRLPSGLYELRGRLKWDAEFHLSPSGDVNEVITLTDQTTISGQLKALADQVAQMERDKIAEIERDGYVRTDIVGISKDSQPGEDIVPDEHDHNDMEIGESDETSDDRAEREGNNGQDEHEHTN